MLTQAVIVKVMMKWQKSPGGKEPVVALGRSLSNPSLIMINDMIHMEHDESYRWQASKWSTIHMKIIWQHSGSIIGNIELPHAKNLEMDTQ